MNCGKQADYGSAKSNWLNSKPVRLAFFLDFKNVVDLMAVLPYYAGLWHHNADDSDGDSVAACGGGGGGGSLSGDGTAAAQETSMTLTYLRVIRLVRVVRILKLTKYSFGLQV